MCVACHQMRPKRELVRIVRTPTGEVKVDLTGKVSGRGAYVCPDVQCVETGMREQRIQHALEVAIPDEVGRMLRQAVSTGVSAGRNHEGGLRRVKLR